MSQLLKFYLFVYNSAQSFGWAISLYLILINLISTKSIEGTYAAAGNMICICQTLSFFEVIHGALGFVPSGISLPLMQWGGRTHFLLAIVRRIDEIHESPAVFVTFLAWSLSEVIRYPHYALQCLGSFPPWLTYIRYTAFIVLYPLGGALGEMLVMYQALPYIKEKNLYGNSFGGLPFGYYGLVQVLLLLYPFMLLKLYLHLLKQRRSKLDSSRPVASSRALAIEQKLAAMLAEADMDPNSQAYSARRQ